MLMKTAMRKKNLLTVAIAAAIACPLGYMAPLMAQEEADLEEITVTGSRIVRRDFEANSPIQTVESAFFDTVSTVGIETALNQLPQFVPAATQFDTLDYVPTANNTPGASTLSLRGLASNRNLVLLDGRRLMPVNAGMTVDLNSIPSAAIQRVETITGGASSVYGADAVAGVVNFILKKDFEGMDIDVQYGDTEHGGGANMRAAALFGANFDNGRGNVMFGIENSSRKRVNRRDREFFTDGWADPTVNGDELFFNDTYYQFPANNTPPQSAIDAIFNAVPPGSIAGNTNFMFNADGTLYTGGSVFNAGDTDGVYRYKGPFEVNGDLYRFIDQEGQIEENQTYAMLSLPLDRYSMFGRGIYEFSDSVSAFAQGTFSQTETFTMWQWTPNIGGWSANIPHGNGIHAPSLAPDGLTTLSAYQAGGAFGLNCAPTGGCTDSQAYPVPPEFATLLDARPDPDAPFALNRVVDYMPPRSLENASRTYQVNFGFEGRLDAIDGTWDFTASHGDSFSTIQYFGYMSLSRYRAVAQSTNYGRNFFQQGNEQQGGFSSGFGTCTSGIPFFFDKAQMTEDCKDAIRADMQNVAQMKQDFAELNVQGRVMDLPAGEMRFAAGGGWRRNEAEFNVDPLSSQNSFTDLPAGNFPTDNTRGSIAVKEIYGELLVPVIDGVPGIQELNLELGYRLSDWENLDEKIDTYKVLADWSFNDALRFRGGYQLANRAANIAELFLGRTQEFIFGPGDMCGQLSQRPNGANPAINPNAAATQALCEQLMGPDAAEQFYRAGNQQPNGFSAGQFINQVGNPLVQSEEAETWTAGFVFQSGFDSPWLANLSATVDWYQIEINDMIAVEGPATVYDACLSPASNPGLDPSHGACQRITRNPISGGMQVTDVTFNNDAYASTSGVDYALNWNADLADIGIDLIPGNLGINFMMTQLLEFETKASPTEPAIDWKGSLGPEPGTSLNGGAFEYRLFTTINYAVNDFALNLRWRHLPEADPIEQAINPGVVTPSHGAEDSYNIFDMSGSWNITDAYQVRIGIDNLFDEEPVITGRQDAFGTTPATSGQGTTNQAFYDTLGRRWYMGFKALF